MSQYYVDFDSNNKMVFYVDDIHDNIPTTAKPITAEEWTTYVADSNLYKLDGETIRLKTQQELDDEAAAQPPIEKTPDQQKIDQLNLQSGDLLFRLAQAQIELNNNKSQTALMLFQLATIQGGI